MAEPGIAHLDLVVSSLERSVAFYEGLLAPLGWTRRRSIVGERGEEVVYLGVEGRAEGSVGLRERRSDAHPVPYDRYAVGVHHVCFNVASRALVDERYAWLQRGAIEIETPPTEYDYTPGYYAVFFHDPDGIKLELLHRPAQQSVRV